MDFGSSLTRVELDPDQMKGGTHSGVIDFRTPLLAIADVTLTSFDRDKSCHPASFPERAELPVLKEPATRVESKVLTRTDAPTSDELWMVILSLISQSEVEKLWRMVRGPSISQHIGLVLAIL